MSEASSVIGGILKNVEFFPFYFWNILGFGIFSYYLMNIGNDAVWQNIKIENVILFSLVFSALVNISIMSITSAVKTGLFSLGMIQAKVNLHGTFIGSGMMTAGFSVFSIANHLNLAFFFSSVLSLIGTALILLGLYTCIWQ